MENENTKHQKYDISISGNRIPTKVVVIPLEYPPIIHMIFTFLAPKYGM
jgi:hypothetical protein